MNDTLSAFSNQLADAVAAVSPSVVQVQGRRRPVSGLVYAAGIVLTSARALGGEDGLHVRAEGGDAIEAELRGWDPATGLAVLRAPALDAPPIGLAKTAARVGHLAIAVARSWSNAPTASAGLVSVIGGPLPTRRGGRIDQVIRTTAPMHDGFAGGAFADVAGGLLGINTTMSIRGLGVVIPAAIAWATAARIVEHGSPQRGYLGVAAQPVRLPEHQRAGGDRETALLVVGVSAGSPAEAAQVLVGDLLLDFDGQPIESPERLLELLQGQAAGRSVPLRVLRGGSVLALTVTVAQRA
jgi:S1-C subfamily serine protease